MPCEIIKAIAPLNITLEDEKSLAVLASTKYLTNYLVNALAPIAHLYNCDDVRGSIEITLENSDAVSSNKFISASVSDMSYRFIGATAITGKGSSYPDGKNGGTYTFSLSNGVDTITLGYEMYVDVGDGTLNSVIVETFSSGAPFLPLDDRKVTLNYSESFDKYPHKTYFGEAELNLVLEQAFFDIALSTDCLMQIIKPDCGGGPVSNPPQFGFVFPFADDEREPTTENASIPPSETPIWFANHARLMPAFKGK